MKLKMSSKKQIEIVFEVQQKFLTKRERERKKEIKWILAGG